MMNLNGPKILEPLQKAAKCGTAFRTYGNNHATLIDLIVDWWISADPKRRWALAGGPTNGFKEKGTCDAILCLGAESVGVLDVEGSRHEFAIEKIGRVFEGRNQHLKSLSFGMLLFYTGVPRVGGKIGISQSLFKIALFGKIKNVSRSHNKFIIIISLEKKYNPNVEKIRKSNEYYRGDLNKINLYLYKNGKEKRHLCIEKSAAIG